MQTNSPQDPTSERICDEAAHWCMRLHEADFSPRERALFERWLASDPAHRREFDAMLEIWNISEFLPGAQGRSQALHASAAPPRARRGRLSGYAKAAAIALLLLPIGGFLGWKNGWLPNDYANYQAGDAVREITLADGSKVQMNLDTRLSFSHYIDRRSVALEQGEAYFEVSHDAEHPFVVEAGEGRIVVTGTHFNVWKYQDQVIVTLSEGSVTVQDDKSRPSQVAYLSPGMQAHYGGADKVRVSSVDTDKALAWRDGKLVLDDLPLTEALPLINRYLAAPVLLGDPDAEKLRIGGIYNTHDIASLVQALPKVLPIYLSENGLGNTVIRHKRGYSPL